MLVIMLINYMTKIKSNSMIILLGFLLLLLPPLLSKTNCLLLVLFEIMYNMIMISAIMYDETMI
jgi:hypothetical protein